MHPVIEEAVKKLTPLCGENCKIGLILGSGLGGYAERLQNIRTLNYAEIEGFPQSHVPGHKGRFVVGELFGKTVICMQGRVHFYEGYPQSELALSVRVMKRLGVEKLLLTNASGGVNLSFSPGDLMLISDHINFSGSNPLIGPNDDSFGTRFPDQGNVYDKELRAEVRKVAVQEGIALQEGVYMMFSGPTFESPAEIVMARTVGASAVGMSTVPEAIAARHCGIKTIGISLITNMAAGILDQTLTHEEVQEAASAASEKFTRLVDRIVKDVF
ncbi:MAG TPA: purine-nucleoside phosphorylase [Candidatus Cryosericum sp.]|nr:purine-nucleoside phosphorylase [Candidatus Cryosericum sp.]